ncbi:MAG: D-2-hydroxyacid dehydrogenase [Christensenellales bacterium]
MNITVLDGYTINPGDLSWDTIAAQGHFTCYDRTPFIEEEIIRRAKDSQIILSSKVPFPAQTLAKLPELRYIGLLATGYDVVDLEAAKKMGIVVTNIPKYSTNSVAQMVFALLLALTNHVASHSAGVKNGRWCNMPDFCYCDETLVELDGKTLGLIGFGSIGMAVARIGTAMGMRLLVYSRTKKETQGMEVTWAASPDEVFQNADVVSLHCPLSPQTLEIVNERTLSLMKPHAFLINTARGRLVNETALAKALNEGNIAGAALDVLYVEPPKADNPLLAAKNCFITPHMSWASLEARGRLVKIAEDNLLAFLQGNPMNVVNP